MLLQFLDLLAQFVPRLVLVLGAALESVELACELRDLLLELGRFCLELLYLVDLQLGQLLLGLQVLSQTAIFLFELIESLLVGLHPCYLFTLRLYLFMASQQIECVIFVF